jgi:Uma2 family endonuclease
MPNRFLWGSLASRFPTCPTKPLHLRCPNPLKHPLLTEVSYRPHNMEMGAVAVGKLTVEEYFKMDDSSEGRLEYHDGEIFPVVAATQQHAIIYINASFCLAGRLKGSPCIAAGQLRVRTTARNYVVPDIAVICGTFIPAAESKDSFTNPKVIVEILSPTTADFDHGGKFALYCELP